MLISLAAVTILVVIVLFLIISNRSTNPEHCVERTDEETGETIIECPNRDPEAYEPETSADESEIDRIEDQLPIYQRRYEIDYQLPESGRDKVAIIIRVLTREVPPPPPNAAADSQEVQRYEDYIREHRRRALNRLNQLGLEEDAYQIYYNENYLIDEFPGTYLPDSNNTNYTGDGLPPGDR